MSTAATISRAELARLRAAGIDAVLLQSKTGITFSWLDLAGACGAEAFTLELGKARPFGQNQQVDLEPSGDSALRDWSKAPRAAGRSADVMQLFAVSREVIKHSDAFRLHLPRRYRKLHRPGAGLSCWPRTSSAPAGWWEAQGARIIFPDPEVALAPASDRPTSLIGFWLPDSGHNVA